MWRSTRIWRNDDYDFALNKYNQALELIGNNDELMEKKVLIMTSIADIMFLKNDYKGAKNLYYKIANDAEEFNNPYILFSIGKCYYENNEKNKAKEYFIKTYMLSGIDIFCSENVKYFESIESMVDIML